MKSSVNLAKLTDIYNNPSRYLNGTAPPNVKSWVNQCATNSTILTNGTVSNTTVCTREASPDSYEWFDTLHPSEQTDRVVAQEFVKVVHGTSNFAMYFS